MPEEFISDIVDQVKDDGVPTVAQESNTDGPVIPKPPVDLTGLDDGKAAAAAETAVDATDATDATAATDDNADTVDATATAAPTIEDLAAQLGWRADHQGEGAVDAATYILRSKEIQSSMRDNNRDLKNQLTTLQGSVDALQQHNEAVYKADLKAKEAEINKLKAEKRAAVELADAAKVEELDNQIDELKDQVKAPAPEPARPATNPVYDEWVKNNQWYLTDDAMANYADIVAQQYVGAPLERIYPLITQKVAEVFPDKFETPAAQPAAAQPALANLNQNATATADTAAPAKANPVGPASPVEAPKAAAPVKGFTKADLSQDQLNIMNQFVKSGIMTEEQYIKDIEKLQGE